MRTRRRTTTLARLAAAALLPAALVACDDSILDVKPLDEISEDIAIVDQTSAQAALVGAYSALQDGDYYGGDYVMWSETLSDNVEHTGTFDSYADGDLLFLRPDVGILAGMWEAIYDGINRVNLLIQKVPGIDMDAGAKASILGQAHALRALHYFNLVRAWGDVPLVLAPPPTLEEAAQVTRSPTAEVWSQIEADLAEAASRLAEAGVGNGDRVYVTPGFVTALEAKAHLYQRDWAAAESAAREVMASGDYALASDFGRLFTPDGDPTSEDVFRVLFAATDPNNLGYYYQYAGRFEIGATTEIYGAYPAGDARYARSFDGTRSDGIQVVKFPTTIGGEDLHVIRFAEVKLILAEALAQQGELAEAVQHLNDVRTRSGAAARAAAGATQATVLDWIFEERRLELAFEGERWFDLVRSGRAAAALGSRFAAHEALWPIPVSELDVAPNLTQNPGY